MDSKQWILYEQKKQLALELAKSLGISTLVAQIMINRGITTVQGGRQFLDCELEQTPDPFLMLGMNKAVARVKQALQHKEKIVIYGDYDADGQTATALLVRALSKLTKLSSQVTYYLPDRLDEGYGLHRNAMSSLAKVASLVITVDCGISAVEEIAYAKELGLDIIVTDHHEPGPILPPAVAILNPKQEKCAYPFRELAGVGVALKLVQGLGVPQEQWQEYLDLVALGTIADLVPIRGENRTLVYHGLKQISNTKNLGLQALLSVTEVENPTAGDLGFRLGPHLNAVGRLGDPIRGVRLLLSENKAEAEQLALELHHENSLRQDLENKVLLEAIEVVEKHDLQKRSALVVWGHNWHKGVIGIVASRLVERYYLPTIVVNVEDGQGTASARSIVGLDLYQALTACDSLLTKYGGHTMAAGLSLPEADLPGFQQVFEDFCARKLSLEDYIPKLFIDGTTTLAEITPELLAELSLLEPHAMGNPGPTLQSTVSVVRTRTVGQENTHLQLVVQDKTAQDFAVIAFNIGKQQALVEKNSENLKIAFVPCFNEWKNKKTVQLQLKAWEPGDAKNSYLQKWMVELYPWRLSSAFYLSSALKGGEQGHDFPDCVSKNQVDLRGIWDKVEALQKHRTPQERTLILVNTPAAVLELCRKLRIEIPGGSQFIGFEHELLTPKERVEFKQDQQNWLVSTGYGLDSLSWPSVWLWEPPLNDENYKVWATLAENGGELVALYGPKDLRSRQSYLRQTYPDRRGLARIYTLLRRADNKTDLNWAYEQLEVLDLLGALPAAIGIFSELGLWKVDNNAIVYQPAPTEKLDLNRTVLYNKITTMRKQSSEYLKHCLERGFFGDELKREN